MVHSKESFAAQILVNKMLPSFWCFKICPQVLLSWQPKS